MENHIYHIRRAPFCVTVLIMHVCILRNGRYANRKILSTYQGLYLNKRFQCKIGNIFSPTSYNIYLGAQKNRLTETVLLSTHNKYVWLGNMKKQFLSTVHILNLRSVPQGEGSTGHPSKVNFGGARKNLLFGMVLLSIQGVDLFWGRYWAHSESKNENRLPKQCITFLISYSMVKIS